MPYFFYLLVFHSNSRTQWRYLDTNTLKFITSRNITLSVWKRRKLTLKGNKVVVIAMTRCINNISGYSVERSWAPTVRSADFSGGSLMCWISLHPGRGSLIYCLLHAGTDCSPIKMHSQYRQEQQGNWKCQGYFGDFTSFYMPAQNRRILWRYIIQSVPHKVSVGTI